MVHEREEYLKSVNGQGDRGNGSYLRNFRSVCNNSLSISIPRSRLGKFKPLTMELISPEKAQGKRISIIIVS